MLIDSFVSRPDVSEKHQTTVNAAPDTVYAALLKTDLGDSLIIKLLLLMRSLPGFARRGFRPSLRNQKITLQTLIDSGFGILAEKSGSELVLGVTGRFWRPTGNLSPFNRDDFDKGVVRGFARAAWNFTTIENDDGQTILATETRVICGDSLSRRKFKVYWFFVRPFSGLIRRIMLSQVRKAANAGH